GDAARRMAGGVEMLRWGHAALVLLRCLVLLLAFRRASGSLPLACAGLVVLLGISVGNLAGLRPQVAGEFFFACVLLALRGPGLSRRGIVLLLLVLVFWANAHGSFPNGFILLVGCLAGRVIEVGWSSSFWESRRILADVQVKRLFWTLVLGVAAVAVLN